MILRHSPSSCAGNVNADEFIMQMVKTDCSVTCKDVDFRHCCKWLFNIFIISSRGQFGYRELLYGKPVF